LFLTFLASSQSAPVIEESSGKSIRSMSAADSHLSRFSTKLYHHVTAQNAKVENTVIAPLSLQLALSLLYQGAVGISRQEIAQAMGWEDMEEEDVRQQATELMSYYASYASDKSVTIQLANMLFVDDDTKINDDYKRVVTENYLSKVETIDYSDTVKSSNMINNMVSKSTNNLITEFMSPSLISPDTVLLLVNAIYFKSNWFHPFFKTQTKKMVFSVSQDTSVEADMMFQENSLYYKHHTELQSQVVSLPYENENFTMLLILPEEDVAVEAVAGHLLGMDFNHLQANLSLENIYLKMPKFEISYKTSLVNALAGLGVQAIFQEELANLSRITEEPLVVSNIIHEAVLKVTEEGSEAAAVTGIELDTRSSGPSLVPVIVTRPFMFVILDIQNNMPLFMGTIVNPTKDEPTLNDRKNGIAVRTALDPEERAYLQNKPQDISRPKVCKELYEYSEVKTGQVVFPCNETSPITDYKNKHGDPARLGINGETAALAT